MGAVIMGLVAVILGWILGRVPTRGDHIAELVLHRLGVLQDPQQQQKQQP
jgi:hypothetical protein